MREQAWTADGDGTPRRPFYDIIRAMSAYPVAKPESKEGAISPVFPYFLLALTLAAMALYRMAVTDPEWSAESKPAANAFHGSVFK